MDDEYSSDVLKVFVRCHMTMHRKRLVKIIPVLFTFVGCNMVLEHSWNLKGHCTLIGIILRSIGSLFGIINVYGTYNGIVPETSLSSQKFDEKSFHSDVPLLVLFSSWILKKNDEKRHNITLTHWASFKPYIIPVVFSNDPHIAEKSHHSGWRVEILDDTAAENKPVLKSMFTQVMKKYGALFYGYANSDILFTNSLLNTLLQISKSGVMDKPILITGVRTNVDNIQPYEARNSESIIEAVKLRGSLFREDSADYFITNKIYPWSKTLPVVIGTAGVDNIVLYTALKNQHIVIDATKTLLSVHQTVLGNNFENQLSSSDHNEKLFASTSNNPVDIWLGTPVCAAYHMVNLTYSFLTQRRPPNFCYKVHAN